MRRGAGAPLAALVLSRRCRAAPRRCAGPTSTMCARSIPMPGARRSSAASTRTSTSRWCGAAASSALEPALAASWKQTAPDRWRFTCAAASKFQDGAPFTADDVVFSFARARAPGSRIAAALAPIARACARSTPHTVEIATNGPDPLLLDEMTRMADHEPAPGARRMRGHRARDLRRRPRRRHRPLHGRGARARRAHRAGAQSALVGPARATISTGVVFTPIADPRGAGGAGSRRGDARHDLRRAAAGHRPHRAHAGPQDRRGAGARDDLPGIRCGAHEMLEGNVARNPFKDRRVREAFARAIDEEAIIAA